MTVTYRLRAAVATTIAATAVAFVAGIASLTSAQAADLCYSAGVSGTITGTHDVPRTCIKSSVPALCIRPSGGVSPQIDAYAEACAPD